MSGARYDSRTSEVRWPLAIPRRSVIASMLATDPHNSGFRIASAPVTMAARLNPIHIDEVGALTKPRVCPISGFDRFASRHNHPSQAEELFDPPASLSR